MTFGLSPNCSICLSHFLRIPLSLRTDIEMTWTGYTGTYKDQFNYIETLNDTQSVALLI